MVRKGREHARWIGKAFFGQAPFVRCVYIGEQPDLGFLGKICLPHRSREPIGRDAGRRELLDDVRHGRREGGREDGGVPADNGLARKMPFYDPFQQDEPAVLFKETAARHRCADMM